MSTDMDNKILEMMSKDPNNWKGIFYVNSDDPRLIVPKLYPSMGWTLNFAHKIAYLLTAAIAAFIIAALVLKNI